MTDSIQIGGIELQVSDRELTPEDTVVCMLKSQMTQQIFTDNCEAPCLGCGQTVVFRPYMAVGQKMCMLCAAAFMKPN